ncbi:MAG: NAD(+)/NADH kinase [Nitrospinae bacterium]|nr:NAD(+)/NADH kinase [Nitrospinota bacterium]
MPKINIKRIGVVAKPQSALAREAITKVLKWGKRRKVEILLDRTAAKVAKEFKTEGVEHAKLLTSIDALIVLGGDGTFLGAARMATAYNIPLLGVNLGSLGFMTEVALEEIDTALDEMYEGQYDTEERMMLDLKIENDKGTRREVALNEIVFSGGHAAKMVELTVSVNGQHVTTYRADGLIISTPTGSTAYALSAGGPILYPTIEAILICPISPHTLTNRPIVVPHNYIMEIDISPRQEIVVATLDGQITIEVNKLDHITVSRSANTTRVVKVPERTHFDTLRSKLGWGGAAANHGRTDR